MQNEMKFLILDGHYVTYVRFCGSTVEAIATSDDRADASKYNVQERRAIRSAWYNRGSGE